MELQGRQVERNRSKSLQTSSGGLRMIRLLSGLATCAFLLFSAPGNCQKPFDPDRNALQDLLGAETHAAKEHKNILLDFGANWCAPCVTLDTILKDDPQLHSLLNAGFVLVHVNVEIQQDSKSTLTVRKMYPKFTLVPHILVLAPDGKLLKEQNIAPLLSDKADFIWDHRLVADFLRTWSASKSN
jgi:thioredoxin 1